MRISGDLIVIDLECTGSHKYITEIGAVYLDRNLNIVDSFETLIHPDEPIEPEITAITNITNEMVEDASTFKDALMSFETWVSGYSKRLKAPKLCAWGTYFDANVFRSVCRHYDVPYAFSGTWYDIKTIAAMWFILSGRKQDKLGVESVMSSMGIAKPFGSFHRAGYDALCEAMILQRALKDLSSGFFLKSSSQSQEYRYINIY